MVIKQKLLILYCAFLISILPSCVTMHQSASTQPKMSVTEAINSIKKAVQDILPTSILLLWKAPTDVAISDEGFTLFYSDNTKKYFTFGEIPDPIAEENHSNFNWGTVQLSKGYIIWFNTYKSAIMFADALYYLKHRDVKQESERGHEDCLRVIRSTTINVILVGATADELAIPCEVNREPAESILNDILIQWKNKGLPEHLQKSSSAQLRDLVTDLEKGILKLDLKAKKLKDLADQDARQATAPGQVAPAKTAPAGALTIAHLLEQRKAILIAILGPVRQAASQRASGG